MTKEDLIAIFVTVAIHFVFGLLAMWYLLPEKQQNRAAFIEVSLGEFKSGTQALKADPLEELDKLNQTDAIEEEQKSTPNTESPVTEQKSTDAVKNADLADSQIENAEDVQEAVESDKIDPTVRTANEKKDIKEEASEQQEDNEIPITESAKGDIKGTGSKQNATQGVGNEKDKSAPYELEWEGEIQRNALVQPLPLLTQNFNAIVRVRFEVKTDGSVGRLVLLRKSGSPEIDQEVQRTVRSWRFSALPSNLPQQSQWGTITFRFVLK